MPNLKSTPHLQATFLLLIAMLSLQSSGSLAKVLFDQFPILTVSAMRLLLGSIILAVLFKIWQVDFKQVKYKAILSYGFALAGMNLLFYLSITRHALAEHHKMDELLEQLTETEFSNPGWLAIAKKLSETVHHHLQEEEHGFFQQAGKILLDAQKTALAKQYQQEYKKYKKIEKDSLV
jgi:hypothetical protein